ncbi:predicted protein [Naegleria gruberi]|uniref:Predicted protein n=1 Tax=Naegleria gruberi TaxID=5762 RepID=D2VKK8_NAEGR|nr:uncharacterized protein NAEGRDRAFT_80322 [Naegleria gruberi]EFC42709.1 predicted protein [Naegleria gruberi]|eukprot:XP_002675453.1 predicted protein [Naegleria gruberi strain NEG-M]
MDNKELFERDNEEHPCKDGELHVVLGGYDCYLKRNAFLCWTGYVQLPKHHPMFNKCYENIQCHVHGGLTYGKDGRFGFDCGHIGDYLPVFDVENFAHVIERDQKKVVYRDYNFVVDNLRVLTEFFESHETVSDIDLRVSQQNGSSESQVKSMYDSYMSARRMFDQSKQK